MVRVLLYYPAYQLQISVEGNLLQLDFFRTRFAGKVPDAFRVTCRRPVVNGNRTSLNLCTPTEAPLPSKFHIGNPRSTHSQGAIRAKELNGTI